MFTGLVQALGRVTRIDPRGDDARFHIAAPDVSGIGIGDSIAVSGVCLTATSADSDGFWTDVSRETLSLTTLGGLSIGAAVNLETSLTLSRPLGGHLMSGHVDGVARLLSRREEGRSARLRFEAPSELARYIARKGSVAVDGVSLTVNDVDDTSFGVNIIPHTRDATTLGRLQIGDRVNIEVDLIARYLERLLQKPASENGDTSDSRLHALLRQQGFLTE